MGASSAAPAQFASDDECMWCATLGVHLEWGGSQMESRCLGGQHDAFAD
jgi:hypothetical protein